MKLTNFAPGNYHLMVQRISYHHHDAYSRYLELGQPANISRETVAELKKISGGRAPLPMARCRKPVPENFNFLAIM